MINSEDSPEINVNLKQGECSLQDRSLEVTALNINQLMRLLYSRLLYPGAILKLGFAPLYKERVLGCIALTFP